jgi:hypothetical protein
LSADHGGALHGSGTAQGERQQGSQGDCGDCFSCCGSKTEPRAYAEADNDAPQHETFHPRPIAHHFGPPALRRRSGHASSSRGALTRIGYPPLLDCEHHAIGALGDPCTRSMLARWEPKRNGFASAPADC